MPRIPLYQQDSLASRVVGTPGVDTSTASAFRTAATEAGNVANQWQIALRQKQREQRAIEKEQQDALEAAELAKYQFQFDAESDRLRTEAQEKNIQDPYAAIDMYKSGAEKALSQFLGKISNPTMRAKVEKAGYGSIQSSTGRINDWTREQRTVNIIAEGDIMLDEFAVKLGTLDTPEQIFEEIEKFEQNQAPVYRSVVGKAFDKKLREAKQKGAINYLSTLSYKKDAKVLEETINSGVFDDLIDGTERAKIYNDVTRYAKAEERERLKQERYENSVNSVQIIGGLRQRLEEGSLTKQDIDEAEEFARKVNANPSVFGAIEAIKTAKVGKEVAEEKKVQTQAEKDAAKRAKELGKVQRSTDLAALDSEFRRLISEDVPTKVRQAGAVTRVKMDQLRQGADPYEVSGLLARIEILRVKGYLSPEKARAQIRTVENVLQMMDRKNPEAATYARQVHQRVVDIGQQIGREKGLSALFIRRAGVRTINRFFDLVEADRASGKPLSRNRMLEHQTRAYRQILQEEKALYERQELDKILRQSDNTKRTLENR